ncbi:MAG: signal recognition particle receptor, partial [Actinomycetota bacterium]
MTSTIYLVLLAVVVAFGIGVVLFNRRRAAKASPSVPARPAAPAKSAPPKPAPVAPVEEPPATDDEPVLERATFRTRMSKARGALTGAFLGIRTRGGITGETWEDLEEALLRADVGVRVTDELLEGLKARVKTKEITDPDALLDALQADMRSRLEGTERSLQFTPGDDGSPNVWLFVGVNGVGKTTTIGKVAAQQTAEGRTVLMAAGDTFRAAAAEQLTTWAERSGAEIVRGNEGGDPGSVIFDAIERAAAKHVDLVLGDTAGRLHTKTNLMDELRK